MLTGHPTPAPDGYAEKTDAMGYAERILFQISEIQSIAERIHTKTYDIAGVCVETSSGEGANKIQEPQNFCEHTLRDLSRLRSVLNETLDNLENM